MPNNKHALSAFLSSIEELRGQLSILSGYIDDHMETLSDHIDWGHVGSANYVLELLVEASRHLDLIVSDEQEETSQ